jgi:hypothetical protein
VDVRRSAPLVQLVRQEGERQVDDRLHNDDRTCWNAHR